MARPTTQQIFDTMSERYKTGRLSANRTYYFSVGSHKYTVTLTPDSCAVEPGKTIDNCDVVLKTTDKLFAKMVLDGKMPGPIAIARGQIKTNDPAKLQELKQLFDFSF